VPVAAVTAATEALCTCALQKPNHLSLVAAMLLDSDAGEPGCLLHQAYLLGPVSVGSASVSSLSKPRAQGTR
jgi:hypothetical protein